MKTVTAQDIIDHDPCDDYTHDQIRKLLADHENWTALEIMELDLPNKDIIWAVLDKSLVDVKTLRLLACCFAETALYCERNAGREPDERSWEAIRVSRLFTEGKATKEELAAARAAAWDAAWAARAVAGAAWAAAGDAARAAWAAAWAARAAEAAAGAARAAAGAAWAYFFNVVKSTLTKGVIPAVEASMTYEKLSKEQSDE